MWNSKKSLVLSKGCVLLFMLALAAALISGPWLVRWVVRVSLTATETSVPYFLITLYSGGALAAFLLINLYGLLNNIGKGALFTDGNVAYMRRISWCCFGGAAICAVSGLYYLPWWVVAVAAAFVGLIVRVVKNVVAEGLALKEENDFTI